LTLQHGNCSPDGNGSSGGNSSARGDDNIQSSSLAIKKS